MFVFLVLFFSDLALAWIAVILVMDGNLRDRRISSKLSVKVGSR